MLAAALDGTAASELPEPPADVRYSVEVLAEGMALPMELDMASDGRVFFIEIAGRLSLWKPETGTVVEAGRIEVATEQENGLLGFALDPAFADNGWIYLFYSPKSESGQRLSRFVMTGDALDVASEKVVMSFGTQRRECCHHAGSVEFGPDGCLFISTGDNTHPHGDSDGFAPIDERPDMEPWDAQKSAANPGDSRGKILRIRPRPEGGYDIPPGNLFPPGTPGTCPEIYAMGCRNPWRMSVDQKTGIVYWGEVGPDAHGNGPRGPRGYDEINQARAAGNFGWPYFIGNNFAYHDYDYATKTVGPAFDPARPRNVGPNNTGAVDLPPAQPALIYYPYGASPEFPEVGQGGRTACAGPVFHYRLEFERTGGFPEYYDNCLLWWDWERRMIKWARLDRDSRLVRIEPFTSAVPVKRMVDATFDNDGRLYAIDYGETWGANADSKLVRVTYTHGNLPPVAVAAATPSCGPLPLKAALSAQGTQDPDGGRTPLEFTWHRGSEVIATGSEAEVVLTDPGDHVIELRVTDQAGGVATASTSVVAGNSRPEVTLEAPMNGQFFNPGQPVAWRVRVHDAEEGDSASLPDSFGPRVLLSVSADRGGAEPPGLALMKSADCFNCHALNHRLVGPSFMEIADRYRGIEGALETSVSRVQQGSSGVWGPVPMLPHGHHTRDQIREMVAWVFDTTPGSHQPVLQRGLSGEAPVPVDATGVRAIRMEAVFTDAGQAPASPLTGRAMAILRPRRLEAELHDGHHGTQVLGGASASGGRFVGDTHHDQHLRFAALDLSSTSSLTCRVASGGHGGVITFHAGSPTAPPLAQIEVPVTGGWETWREITTPLPLSPPPPARTDFFAVFRNPGQGGLMNLDWVQFNP
ncbi:MAG: PQQ-dependent sugar dehydrogenase [Verrucomicrobiales bacterium]